MTSRTTTPQDPDAPARDALMDDYRRRRLAAGITSREVSRCLGMHKTSAGQWEARRPANPLVSSLATYGEVIGLRPVFTLEGVEAAEPPAFATLLAMGYVGAAWLTKLIATRKQLGFAPRDLAARSTFSRRAVLLMELDDHEPHLETLQAYARGLGGRLDVRWEEL